MPLEKSSANNVGVPFDVFQCTSNPRVARSWWSSVTFAMQLTIAEFLLLYRTVFVEAS
jgi:hypothetical protein